MLYDIKPIETDIPSSKTVYAEHMDSYVTYLLEYIGTILVFTILNLHRLTSLHTANKWSNGYS